MMKATTFIVFLYNRQPNATFFTRDVALGYRLNDLLNGF